MRHRRVDVTGGPVFAWVIDPVDGAEGAEVQAAQNRAIGELVQWLSNRRQAEDHDPT